MAKIYGDIDLQKGRILNLKIEKSLSLPSFSIDDIGRLYFDESNNSLKINNGSEWITIPYSNFGNNPLIETLGNNWINEDSSFNPTPFNELDNISGLTSNDSLFNVIEKLDEAISNIQSLSLEDLTNVEISNLQLGDVLYYNGTTYANASLNTLANTVMQIPTSKLSDVQVIDSYSTGQILIRSENNKFVNKTVSFEYTNTAENTNFVVNHQLGKQYCFIQLINVRTNKNITNYEVIFNDKNQLTINLPTAAPIKVLVLNLSIS